jgi:hypothetical protein
MCGGQEQRVMLAGFGRRKWKATATYLDIPVRDRFNVEGIDFMF